MEKKTIGSFISVLRRAHGMTQKELGEKLFVSDKTVSRWERDECTPDLSLIPIIADLFGVTADELLRGERKSEISTAEEGKNDGKSEKQYRNLLHTRMGRYKNFTLIAAGISALGLIGAMICNLGFTKANVGFCIGLIFLLAGSVFQICACNHYYMRTEDDEHIEEIRRFNTRVITLTKNAAYLILILFGIQFPLLFCPAYYGLTAETWVLYGILSALVCLILGAFLYEFILKNRWIKHGLLSFSESENTLYLFRRKWIKKLICIALAIGAALGLSLAITRSIDIYMIERPERFDNYEDFKEYMEKSYSYGYTHSSNGKYEIVYEEEWIYGDLDQAEKEDTENADPIEVRNPDGELLLTYYHKNELVRYVEFSFEDDLETGLPIKAYTEFTLLEAQALIDGISSALCIAIVSECLICCVIYLFKRTPKKQ